MNSDGASSALQNSDCKEVEEGEGVNLQMEEDEDETTQQETHSTHTVLP